MLMVTAAISSAESTCTSRSTTPPAWPTSRFSPTRKASTAVGFLRRAVAHYAAHAITVERLITDNGAAYRSTIHAIACRLLGIRQRVAGGRAT
jgi:Integrase core domain